MPFQLITPKHQDLIAVIVEEIPSSKISLTASGLARMIDQIKDDIPEKKRISTGRYSIVKALGSELFSQLEQTKLEVPDLAARIFNLKDADPFVRSIAIQLLAHDGLHSSDLDLALLYFEKAAADGDWIVRECAAGLIRKVVKEYPDQLRDRYLNLVLSPDPNQRRFVSESLRPVVENRWFHKNPEYALGIIKHLFQESVPYPRTSVGNNLSDWMRVNQDIAWPILTDLAQNGNKNSYWIAYRACRNQVKKNPGQVLELLKVDRYRYKDRIYENKDLPTEGS